MATSGEDVIPSSFVREYKISNYYCCVYDCNSNGRYDSEISFHKFPKDENIRKQWVVKIRRDIGNDFQISKTTVVCCKHFKTEDYVGWTPSKTRRLKKGIVPSVFDWSEEKTARRLLTRKPTATSQPKTKRLRLDGADHSTLTSDEQPGGSGEDILTATPLHIEQHREIDMLKDQLQKKTEECSNVNKQLAVVRFLVSRFSKDDKLINFYTGFSSYLIFLTFYQCVEPSTSNMLSKYYEAGKTLNLPGRKRSMLIVD